MYRKTTNNIVDVGSPGRLWAIPAIHGDVLKLIHLHDTILQEFKLGDRLVYLGNYTGYGRNSIECVNELLTFRRLLLSHRGMRCDDLIYIRGAQEQMWNMLMQLPFAPDPGNVLLWMLGNGMSATLESYDISPHDGIEACKQGVMGLTKWVNGIRAKQRQHAGHETFSTHLVRAAHTQKDSAYPMLFVNSGFNPARALEDQGDHLWWSSVNFEDIDQPAPPFQKIIRGYDPKHRGIHMNCVTATIDGGCGFGGPLVSAAFDFDGEVARMIEV